MNLTGLDLGAWLTKSAAVVLLPEYDEVSQVFIGHVVHPMREVRYGKDGRLVSCCFLPGESQTVEHEQKLHDALHLDRKLDLEDDAISVVNLTEWLKGCGSPTPAPPGDWVEITDANHVLRPNIDWVSQDGLDWWTKMLGETVAAVRASFPLSTFRFRCLREHHPNFAPARRQDSAGAGIYDEQPPLVNTYADRTLNASRLLQNVVEGAKPLFDDPAASIEVVPPPLREWRVLTPGGCWETVKADVVTTCNTSVDMYRNGQQVGFFVNPQAAIAGREVDPKPVVPSIDVAPLGDALDHLYRLLVHGTSSVAEKDAVKACVERFNNLVNSIK